MDPSPSELVNRPMFEHLGKINIRDIMLKNFRTSVSLLIYSNQQNTAFDVNERSKTLSSLLHNNQVMNHLEPKLLAILQERFGSHSNSYWSEWIAWDGRDLLSHTGNYYEALCYSTQRMIIKSFTYLLADVDRNSNMQVLGREIQLGNSDGLNARLWLDLCKCSCSEPPIKSPVPGEHLEWNIVQVDSDGMKSAFKARFPFSHLVCRTVYALRSIAESSPSSVQNLLCKQLELTIPSLNKCTLHCPALNFQANKRSEACNDLFDSVMNYLYDYMCMYGHSSSA
ncbi:hypothetical protein AKO1_007988, partial [Acrasis kona]